MKKIWLLTLPFICGALVSCSLQYTRLNSATGKWEPISIYYPEITRNENKKKPSYYITAFDIIFVDEAMYDFKQAKIRRAVLNVVKYCKCSLNGYIRNPLDGKPAPFVWKEYPYQLQIMSIKTGSQTNPLLMFFDMALVFLFPYQQKVEYQVVARLYDPKGKFIASFETDKIKRDYSIWLLNIFTKKNVGQSGYDHKYPQTMQLLQIIQKVSDRIEQEQPDIAESQDEQ